jgi:hypothetical protein
MAPMKILLLALAVALVACGCSSTQRPAQPAAANPNPGAQPAVPTATPINVRSGKVASVNLGARFIVIDFSVGGVPAEGRTLGVYRGGQKVAEVKISGPVIGTNTAADILSGNAQVGDVVRED